MLDAIEVMPLVEEAGRVERLHWLVVVPEAFDQFDTLTMVPRTDCKIIGFTPLLMKDLLRANTGLFSLLMQNKCMNLHLIQRSSAVRKSKPSISVLCMCILTARCSHVLRKCRPCSVDTISTLG